MSDEIDLEWVAHGGYAAAFSDACDSLGYRHQTLPPGIVPQVAMTGVLVGWARVSRSVEVDEPADPPYGAEIAFLDSLKPGDVVVATSGGAPVAMWGELFSAAARARGARGSIIDGLIRDRDRIENLGFFVFAKGTRPTDSLGRLSMIDTTGPIQIGGVTISHGDLIVADCDGVVVVPKAISREVTHAAMNKATTERRALVLLNQGAFLSQVWNELGVL